MHVRIVKCDIPRFGGRIWLGIGPSRGCQRRTEFLYEAVKEQRYADSRSHEETPKARQKQPQKNPKKKNKLLSCEKITHTRTKSNRSGKERKKEGNEGSKLVRRWTSILQSTTLFEGRSKQHKRRRTTITTALMLYSHCNSCAILSVMQAFYFTFFLGLGCFFWVLFSTDQTCLMNIMSD